MEVRVRPAARSSQNARLIFAIIVIHMGLWLISPKIKGMWAGDGGVTKEQRLGTVIGKLRMDLDVCAVLCCAVRCGAVHGVVSYVLWA